jgi:hypothetical protein
MIRTTKDPDVLYRERCNAAYLEAEQQLLTKAVPLVKIVNNLRHVYSTEFKRLKKRL